MVPDGLGHRFRFGCDDDFGGLRGKVNPSLARESAQPTASPPPPPRPDVSLNYDLSRHSLVVVLMIVCAFGRCVVGDDEGLARVWDVYLICVLN